MTGVKTSFNLPSDSLRDLKELAEEGGVSMTDVIRRALATEKFLVQTQRSGGKILIEDADKTCRQVVFR